MPTKTELEPKNIAKIKSTLLHPATTSHFEVRIGLPSFPTNGNGRAAVAAGQLNTKLRRFLTGNNQEELNLMCSEAVLPGSQLATTEVFNNYTGVTERHAYRRIYDETIDLTFYVDAGNYTPIRFFEAWMNEIVNENQEDALNPDYFYRVRYPNEYVATGLKVIKFEKTANRSNTQYAGGQLEYEFVRSYPRSITSMPVTYDGSSLLKCSVQMTYLRYVVHHYPGSDGSGSNRSYNPFQQSQFNLNGFLSRTAANLVDQVVDDLTGVDVVGDIAGGFAGQWASQTLSNTGIGILQR